MSADMGADPAPVAGRHPSAPGANAGAERPAALASAVQLMYAGMALSFLWGVSVLLQRDTLKAGLRSSLIANGDYTADRLSQSYRGLVDGALIFAAVGVVLWALMIRWNGRGRIRARLGGTILGVLGVLLFFSNLATAHTWLGALLLGASAVLGLVIVTLMWQPECTDYYAARSGRRPRLPLRAGPGVARRPTRRTEEGP